MLLNKDDNVIIILYTWTQRRERFSYYFITKRVTDYSLSNNINNQLFNSFLMYSQHCCVIGLRVCHIVLRDRTNEREREAVLC